MILFIPIHTSNTRVAFFNVGDGDSIFIQSPHGNILIDVGEWEGDYCPAKTTIVPYLKKWGINHIDAILLTHYHSDHYGGIPYIISRIPEIDVLLLPDTNSLDKKVFIEHMVQKDGFKIPCKNVDQKMVFKESEESSFVIFPVYKLYSAEMTMNENDNSIISKYLCGNISFLFTGDLEANGEEALLSYSRNQLHSTVLKVGHHGSNTSTTDEFLEAVKPKYAIISCGKYSYCKHPSNKVLED